MIAKIATSIAAVAFTASSSPAPAHATEPFLKSTGARGILEQEEEFLFALRQQKEGEAIKSVTDEIELIERETKLTQDGKLCGTPFGVDVVGISETVALLGALIGGIAARQRKDEVEKLNEQLRKINLQLRQQSRAGTIYAPGLTYAPPSTEGGSGPATALRSSGGAVAVATMPVVAAAAPVAAMPAPKPAAFASTMEEEEMSTDQISCRDALRAGKRLLKEKNGPASLVRFEKALMLSKALSDKIQERRANRGMAASLRLLGQYKQAIKHLERILDISREMREFTGDSDAYGTIADCYTDMGEFEKAAIYYDKYIASMDSSS